MVNGLGLLAPVSSQNDSPLGKFYNVLTHDFQAVCYSQLIQISVKPVYTLW